MFPSSSSSLSLIKVVTGLSKTLGIIREVIPIYEQAKPMVQGLKKVIGSVNMPRSIPTNNKSNNILENKKITTSNSNFNSPSFFL